MRKRILVSTLVSATLILLAVLFITRPTLLGQSLTEHNTPENIRLRKVQEVYNSLVAPTAAQVMAGQHSVAHLFDLSSVRGRVTPVGVFHDPQGVVEYFYGLAATPTSIVDQVTFKTLVADQRKVALRVDIHFSPTPGAPGTPYTLTQTGFFTFNEQNLISSVDLSILNLGAIADPKGTPEQIAAQQDANIRGLCGLLTTGVPGVLPPTCPNEYQSFNACVDFMKSKPYGSWNRANSDTVTCRQLHALLTPFRPDVHCSHAGPTGGHACIDFPYESFYDEDF